MRRDTPTSLLLLPSGSMGSYATPALIGGARIRVVVTEIYTQATAVFNWPLAASLSLTLLALALAVAQLARRLEARGLES